MTSDRVSMKGHLTNENQIMRDFRKFYTASFAATPPSKLDN